MQVGDLTRQDASVQLPVAKVVIVSTNSASIPFSQPVSGIGFKPSAIFGMGNVATAANPGLSMGIDNQVDTQVATQDTDTLSTGSWTKAGGFMFVYRPTAIDTFSAVIASFDDNGFTITWTKGGTASFPAITSCFLVFK